MVPLIVNGAHITKDEEDKDPTPLGVDASGRHKENDRATTTQQRNTEHRNRVKDEVKKKIRKEFNLSFYVKNFNSFLRNLNSNSKFKFLTRSSG